MAIKIWSSREEYTQANKDKDESTIGLIEIGKVLTHDGVNVYTNNPQKGDIVLLDETNKIKFIKAGTYSPQSSNNPIGIPTTWTKVGVVGFNDGDNILIINASNASKVWINGYLWRVTGWNLDGESHSTDITFTLGASTKTLTFTYAAESLDEVATQFTSFCNENLSELSNQRFLAYVGSDGNLVVQKDAFSDYRQYNFAATGLTVTNIIAEQSPATSSANLKLMNGLTGGSVMNVGRYIGQYGGSTDADRNPTSLVNSIPATPVSLAAYKGSYCQYLRDLFGDGDEGYYNYIASYLAKLPDFRGLFSATYKDSLANTHNLAQYKITKYGETTPTPLYTAADYCANIEYNHPLLAKGNWCLPSVYLLYEIIPGLTYHTSQTTWGLTTNRAQADIINRSLYAIGGSALPLSSIWWSSVRWGSYISWLFYSYGYLGSNGAFNSSLLCVPCCFLDLRSLNN